MSNPDPFAILRPVILEAEKLPETEWGSIHQLAFQFDSGTRFPIKVERRSPGYLVGPYYRPTGIHKRMVRALLVGAVSKTELRKVHVRSTHFYDAFNALLAERIIQIDLQEMVSLTVPLGAGIAAEWLGLNKGKYL